MPNTAEILVDTLIAWDVRVIFGLPGDGINGIMEALRTRLDKIRFVQVRHEESAAFMATAYAKWTGKLGVCLATSGPGGTHLLTRVFNDVSVFNAHVADAAHMENVASLACRSALAGRGVSHLSIASDVQEQTSAKRSPRNLPRHTPSRWFEGSKQPDEAQLDLAANILNAASKWRSLPGVALSMPRRNSRKPRSCSLRPLPTPFGKAVLPDDHPNVVGGIGILGTLASQEIMEQCEAPLIVGSTFPYIGYYPKPGKARGVQVDRNAQRIGLRHPSRLASSAMQPSRCNCSMKG
jgi:pyruvate dehydrogenase (quinone)